MLKNFLKQFAVLDTRSKIRSLRRNARELFFKPEVKYFSFFFTILLGTYACVDIIVDPVFRYPIATFQSDYSLLDVLQFLNAEVLKGFRNTPMSMQILVLSLDALVAYWFTLIALKPLEIASEREKFFATNAAHELATPLTIIKTTAEVVRMKHYQLPEENMVAFTDSVIEEVNRMSEVLKYFLHFAVPRKTHLHMTGVDMTGVFRGVLRKLSQYAKERSVNIVSLPRTPRMVWGNTASLEEMIISLLKNSIAYSAPNGTISISFTETSQVVMLSIANEGAGVPDDDLLHIFDPFFRGTNALAGGRGFGLAIVQEIAKLHLAVVTVKNNKKGVAFSVCLPK